MHPPRQIAIVTGLLAVLVVAAAGQHKTGGIHKVAVLSVTGPARLNAAGQRASLQDAIDYAEASLVRALSAKGLRVVSLADSKTFAGANWEAAYSNSLRDDSKPAARAENQSASRNTLVLRDLRLAENQASGRLYSAAFYRAAGELARRMGADGAVLLTLSPGLDSHRPPKIQQVIQVLLIDQSGETIFRDEVRRESEVRQESREAKNFDAQQLSAAINKATDEGIRVAIEHYSGK